MRVARFMTAAGLAWLMAITMSVSPTAQTKTDEDFDQLMKGVGGTIGGIRKGAEGGMMDQVVHLARLAKDPRGYGVLSELNTRPRTSYLASVTNPNPEMPRV